MKTYFRDFSIDNAALINDQGELEELINNRQNKFCKTVEYTELDNKIKGLMNKLAELSPEAQKILSKLRDEVLHLECANYSAAYRDGMADIMAAITLNKLNVTKVEYMMEGRAND